MILIFSKKACATKTSLTESVKPISTKFGLLLDRVGKADQETGSGVYAYTYELSNGNSVVLIFLQLDSLYSAHLVDASGKVVKTLVAPPPDAGVPPPGHWLTYTREALNLYKASLENTKEYIHV